MSYIGTQYVPPTHNYNPGEVMLIEELLQPHFNYDSGLERVAPNADGLYDLVWRAGADHNADVQAGYDAATAWIKGRKREDFVTMLQKLTGSVGIPNVSDDTKRFLVSLLGYYFPPKP